MRQLNFYGFRKIKFSDNIKIDEKLERETKDYWRFRHECFRKGREDLLTGIKRSNSNQNEKKTVLTPAKTVVQNTESKKEVHELKEELESLKDRIARMTDNIDSLTTLVRNVKLEEKKTVNAEVDVHAGSKRKKMDATESDNSESFMEVDTVISAESSPLTNNDLESISFTPSNIFPSGPLLRQNSATSNISDAAFVDELFNALDGDDMEILPPETMSSDVVPDMIESSPQMPLKPTIKQEQMPSQHQHPNSPDPKLMNRLSDALAVLPKDMQELLVNRLIATITSSDSLKAHLESITESKEKVPGVLKKKTMPTIPSIENSPEVALPLAAATLTALMAQMSAAMKDKKTCMANNSLPVIPIHA